MTGAPRPLGLARNLRLGVSWGVRALLDDPVWLTVQAVRRSPARFRRAVTTVLGAGPPTSAPYAAARYLAGDHLGAAEAASRLLTRSPGSRVGAEVAVAVGRADLLQDGHAHGPATLRALWQQGDASAVRTARVPGRSGRRARESILGEVEALSCRAEVEPRPAPPRPAPGPPPRSARPTTQLTVLHHLTSSLPHTQSGYTLRTHAVLAAQRAAGLHVVATTRAGYPVTIGSLGCRGVDVVDGVAYHRLIPRSLPADRGRRLAEATELLVRAAEQARPDILQTTTPWSTGEVARAAARILGVPWVYEVRGLPEETWAASHTSPAARERAGRSERRTLLRARETELATAADAVVTLSATMRDELVSRGVRADRVTVVPNSVAASMLSGHPAPWAARRSLGLPAAAFVVGTVSSLVGYEGQETILRTVAELRHRGTDASALVVGDGVFHARLVALADELGLGPHAVFTGRVPHALAHRYLAALDVLLVPRRDDRVTRLVTPLKPVEAMAVGRPVVASDLPALAEALGLPRGGLLVPADDVQAWADAVESLRADPALYRRLVDQGRTVASGRTWEDASSVYQQVYRRCLGAAA